MKDANETSGVRLHPSTDIPRLYLIARFGVTVVASIAPISWGSPNTARCCMRRLERLRLVRSFPRNSPAEKKWWALTRQGYELVLEATGCAEGEVRYVSGIRRLNLRALAQRNDLWASCILAARTSREIQLSLFRPEWELRRMSANNMPIVPDAMMVLGRRDSSAELAWMLEQDSGSERSAVLRAKATHYAEARSSNSFYGATRWKVLFVVPSRRRALTVAAAMVNGGAGAFSFVGIAQELYGGYAFARVLWRSDELVLEPKATPGSSLIDELLEGPSSTKPINADGGDEEGSPSRNGKIEAQ